MVRDGEPSGPLCSGSQQSRCSRLTVRDLAPSTLWVYVAGPGGVGVYVGRRGGTCSSQATPGAFYLFLIKAASPIQLKTFS